MQVIEIKPEPYSPAQIAACSRTIESLGFGDEFAANFHKYGAMYLGEARLLNWGTKFIEGQRTTGNRARLEMALKELGLTVGTNPLARGWRPLYWNDPKWLITLKRPIVEELGSCGERFLGPEVRVIGQLVRSFAGQKVTAMYGFQTIFPRNKFQQLRAGMLIPPDWKPMV